VVCLVCVLAYISVHFATSCNCILVYPLQGFSFYLV
jgi:hypothetical protein